MLHNIVGSEPNVSHGGATALSKVSQIQTDDRQTHIERAATVENLVAALRATEQALRANIEAEEAKTLLSDQNDRCYSMLARSMRTRADNLRMTIATLEAARRVA